MHRIVYIKALNLKLTCRHVRYLTDTDEADDFFIYGNADSNAISQQPINWPLDPDLGNAWRSSATLQYRNNQNGFFACVARGVFPYPTMTAMIGDMRLPSNNLALYHRVTLEPEGEEGIEGLRRYVSHTVLYTRNFPVDAEDVGKQVTCEGTVTNRDNVALGENTATARLALQGWS